MNLASVFHTKLTENKFIEAAVEHVEDKLELKD
jgi:hypothetical protein